MSKSGFYIPSLDGIRAVAVLLVFFAHTNFGHIVPGGLGVTIFFFLSGYLITTLMRIEFEKTAGLSLKKFYLRRVYRIFPPLYIVLLITLALSLSGLLYADLSVKGVLAQFFHLTNYYLVIYGDQGLLPGMAVTWSLAVEEHFYLLFPLLFLWLVRRVSPGKFMAALGVLCAAVLCWRIVIIAVWGLPDNYGETGGLAYAYYATDARMDCLLFGCLMAVGFNPVYHQRQLLAGEQPWWGKAWAPWLALFVGLGLLLFTLLYRDSVFRETLRYSLQGLAFMPLFYFAIIRSQWLFFKCLNWQPVVYLGRLSYTFYLSHYVCIYVVIKLFGDTLLVRNLGGFALTLAFSSLMYHFVEQRFAQLRKTLHD
ncbi:MAG: acyltransferase [Cellvibrionaceae bacterium]|nr:acyltransferase [Cellvibrionaceae bacterium]